MSSTWASVVPADKIPKDTHFRRPLRPSCDAVFAPISVRSGTSRALNLWKPVSSSTMTMTSTSRAAPVSSSTRASDRQPVTPGHGTDQQFSQPVSSLIAAHTAR